MRLTRFIDPSGLARLGDDLGDGRARVLAGNPFIGGVQPTDEVVSIATRLRPVQPLSILAIGLNYTEHAKETGAAIPERPMLFAKHIMAAQDPDAPIRLPRCSHQPEVDYEAELAVVIGKAARDVPVEQALDYVLGYTAANDVSARWWQKKGCNGQFVRGKSFDTFCPLGPVLVTPDELPDPQDLAVRCRLNGQTMQDGHTSDMIFSVAELIAFVSQDTTLPPGTVLLTGTPPGVGVARDPQVFLQPGDTVEVEVQGIGVLRNTVIAPDTTI